MNAWPVVAHMSLYARRRLVILAFIIVLRPVITRGRGDSRYGFAVVTRRDERTANPAEVIRAKLQRVKRDAPRVAPRGVLSGISCADMSRDMKVPGYAGNVAVGRSSRVAGLRGIGLLRIRFSHFTRKPRANDRCRRAVRKMCLR